MELCRARPGGGREKRSLVVDRRAHGWRRADQCGLAILAGPATREHRDRGARALGRPVGRGWIRGAATLFRRRVSDGSPKRWWRRRIELDYFVGTIIGAPRSGRLGGSWGYGVASAGLRLASAHDRLTVGIDASNWMGEDSSVWSPHQSACARATIIAGVCSSFVEGVPSQRNRHLPISGSPATRVTSGPHCFERIRS